MLVKEINYKDMQKGYDLFLENSYVKQNNDIPHAYLTKDDWNNIIKLFFEQKYETNQNQFDTIIENLNINKNSISIKATTNEKSGLIGRGDFIACWSNISLREN